MNDFPQKLAKYMINDLFRYWKNHGKPCLMPGDLFGSLVWCTESGLMTRIEFKDRLKLFFTDEKYRNVVIQLWDYAKKAVDQSPDLAVLDRPPTLSTK